MSGVIPLNMLNQFSWKQVENLVCGEPDIDVEKLKKKTKYEGWNENDNTVKWFWEVLGTDFTAAERIQFLRFVWGRSKLPAHGEYRNFQLTKLYGNIDESLPISHTCFFHLELPEYSNKDNLKNKLLYAITHCTAIDLDFVESGGFEEEEE